jgi:hypothetical protein
MEKKRNLVIETLPSGIEIAAAPMDILDANNMFSTSNPAEQLYKILEHGIVVDPDGEAKPYSWRKAIDSDNFAAMITRRRATFGDQFSFLVNCSSCNYGKKPPGVAGLENPNWRAYHTVHLGQTYLDPQSEEPIENPQKIMFIRWETSENECDGVEKIFVDRESKRFMIWLEDTDEKMVLRLTMGSDAAELRKIMKYPAHSNERASAMLELKFVGFVGEEIGKEKDWRKAKYPQKKPGHLTEARDNGLISYGDFDDLTAFIQYVDGGIETDLDVPCPVCGAPLISTDTDSTLIPFYTRSFFSRTSTRRRSLGI